MRNQRIVRNVAALGVTIGIALVASEDVCALSLRTLQGEDQPIPAGWEVVDVPTTALSDLPLWRLADEPMVSIGLVDGPAEYLLGNVRSAVFLPDGRIAVADIQERAIRLYDAAGTYVGAIGRPGAGPGEFRDVVKIAATDDSTLVAWDSSARLVKVFNLDGSVRSEWRSSGCIGTGQGSLSLAPLICRGEPVGFLRSTAPVFASNTRSYASEDHPTSVGDEKVISNRAIAIAALMPDSVLRIDSLFDIDMVEIGVRLPYTSVLGATRLFDGAAFVAARAPWVVYGNSEQAQLRVIDPEGSIRRILRLGFSRELVTNAHLDAVREAGRERRRLRPNDEWNDYLDDFIRLSGRPTHVPFFDALQLDSEGRIWIRDYALPWSETEMMKSRVWTVLGTDGTPEARIELSSKDILDIWSDHMMVLAVDEATGVNRIEVYQIQQGGH